jgi:putative transposase
MGSTYYNLKTHVVFSTKERRRMIDPQWISRLHAYLGGCARTIGAVAEEVGGVDDHVHLMLSLRPALRLSDVLREIKSASSAWVHDEIGEKLFAWQQGYSAFSVSASQVERVRRTFEIRRNIIGAERTRTRSASSSRHTGFRWNRNDPAPLRGARYRVRCFRGLASLTPGYFPSPFGRSVRAEL